MRLGMYIKNNITQKPGRTTLAIIGITLTIIDIIVMSLLTKSLVATTAGFFTPFDHLDQIIEKGTDFTQLLPLSSSLNESSQPRIEEFFNESIVPMLMIAETENVSSFYSTYYIGLPIESMKTVWDQIMLVSGQYPNLNSQVIVGNYWKNETSVEIKGVPFVVSGVLNEMHTFLDRVIVLNLESLQELGNRESLVTLFFISRESPKDLSIIEQFEDIFPTFDYLTISERDTLKGGMDRLVNELAVLFTTFTAISASIFVFAVELLTILNRKNDFNIFFVLGSSKLRVFLVLTFEILILFLIGIILGFPLSIVLYILIWSYIITITKVNVSFWTKVGNVSYNFFQQFPYRLFLSNISLILLFGLIFAIVAANIGLRTYNLEEMKQKF